MLALFFAWFVGGLVGWLDGWLVDWVSWMLVGWLYICLFASVLALNSRNSTKRRIIYGVQLTLACLELARLLLCLLGLVACFALVCFALLACTAWFALICLLGLLCFAMICKARLA